MQGKPGYCILKRKPRYYIFRRCLHISFTGLPFDEALYKSDHSLEDAEILVGSQFEFSATWFKAICNTWDSWGSLTKPQGWNLSVFWGCSFVNQKSALWGIKSSVGVLQESVNPMNDDFVILQKLLKTSANPKAAKKKKKAAEKVLEKFLFPMKN